MDNGDRRDRRERFLARGAALALLALVAALHADALGDWWKFDDPQILLHAIRNTPAETLFSPPDWQTLQTVSFTPLLTLSFDLDNALAGPRPRFFYVHQLAAALLVALLLFVLLRTWCGDALALLTAAAAGAGPAIALATESLMIRHYLEGLALAVAALLVWRSGDRTRFRIVRDGSAAVLYLLAVLAKEVFAPLPLLFAAEAAAARVPAKRIALRLAPSALVALLYLGWRLAMLGSLGGYGEPASLHRLPGSAWSAYQALFAAAPGPTLVLAPLLTVAAALVALWRRPKETALIGGALLIGVLLPFLGVAGLAEARYGFVPLVAAVAATGLALAQLPRAAAIGGGALLLLLHGFAGVALGRHLDRTEAAHRAEGMYVWRAAADAPVLFASSPGWYLTGVRDLRRSSDEGDAPHFVLSSHGIVAAGLDPGALVRIEGDPPLPRPLDAATIAHLGRLAASLKTDAPLEVRVAVIDHAIEWDLGPERGSSFGWLTVPEYGDHPIPPRGSFRVPLATERQRFRIRRELGDGAWTLSPVFDVPANGKRIAWRREAATR